MKEQLSDEFLYKHIPRAERVVIDSMPAEDELDHTFSNRFLRKMQALLKYQHRGSFGRFATQLGRVVAAVLVVVLLLNTVLVVSVEAYREKFFEIIQTVTEKFTSFFVDVDGDAPVTEFISIEPPYIPDGFEMIDQFRDENRHTVIYLNDGGQEIYYCQMMAGIGVLYFDTEDASVETLQIMGQEIYVITEDNMIQVYWAENSFEFLIISNFDHDGVLAVAESIIKNN